MMAVYVDDAAHPFQGMVMCHMWADTHDELLAMADRIGVARQWLQAPPAASWVHFDVCRTKRQLAVRAGAVQTDKYGPVVHTAQLDIASGDPTLMARGRRKLAQIAECRARGEPEEKPAQGSLF